MKHRKKWELGVGSYRFTNNQGDSCEFVSLIFFKKLVNTPKFNFFFHPKETIAKENSLSEAVVE